MFIALTKFLWFLTYLDPLMFRCQFRCMILLIAFHTKMSILGNTIPFCILWRYFIAILAKRSFTLLFFLSIYNVINNIDWKNLVIFKYDILMSENLRIFILIVEINRLESLRTCDWLINKLIFTITI